MKNFLRTVAAALSLLVAASAMAQEPAVKIRFGYSGAETDSQHMAAQSFANAVKLRSNGAIDVQLFPGSALGNDKTMITGVRAGSLDMEMSGSPNFSELAPKMTVLDIPYLFTGSPHVYKVLDGPIGRGLLDELNGAGLKGLAFWEVGFRSITNNVRPVLGPADLKGLKLRTSNNPLHQKAFWLLGTYPMPIPLNELYKALETRQVDAQEHPVGITWSSRFYEVQKYLTLTRHAYTPLVLVMNRGRFDRLSAAYKKIVLQAAAESAQFQREQNARNEQIYIADLKLRGMQVIETVDPAPFRKIVAAPIRQFFAEKNGPDLLNAIDKAAK